MISLILTVEEYQALLAYMANAWEEGHPSVCWQDLYGSIKRNMLRRGIEVNKKKG